MTLVKLSASILEDAKLYLQAIDNQTYTIPIALLSDSTIGQHTRHFVEFYLCLMEQAAQSSTINYDKRQRDKQIEQSPKYTIQTIDYILEQLGTDFPERDYILEAEFEESVSVPTYFKRELLYNIEHSIHHLAIIKIGLKVVAPTLVLPKHFGVACSTMRHHAEK